MTGEVWRGGEKERENLLAEARRNGWASMHGGGCTRVCTRCQLREGRTERGRRCDTGGRMDGWRRVGGECQGSGGEGLNSLYYTP